MCAEDKAAIIQKLDLSPALHLSGGSEQRAAVSQGNSAANRRNSGGQFRRGRNERRHPRIGTVRGRLLPAAAGRISGFLPMGAGASLAASDGTFPASLPLSGQTAPSMEACALFVSQVAGTTERLIQRTDTTTSSVVFWWIVCLMLRRNDSR